MNLPSIDVVSLSHELRSATPPQLLDVREADELEVSALPGIHHIPLGELAERWTELDASASWVVICRIGGRSARATAFLMANGFDRVRNLDGGMNEWARKVDPSLPEY